MDVKSERQNKMSWRGTLFRVVVSSAILMVAFLGAVLMGRAGSVAQKTGQEIKKPGVEVLTVKAHQDGVTFEVDGLVVPFRCVSLSAEVSGRICFLSENSRVGRYVRKGEPLLEIDSTDYILELEQAKQQETQSKRALVELDVSLENLSRQILIAQKQLELQKRDLQRVERLTGPGAISASERDTAQLNVLKMEEAYQTLENEQRALRTSRERLTASVKLATVAVEKAQVNLSRCKIMSPLDGIVEVLSVEENTFVQRGGVLMSIHDTSRLEVRCSLYMKQVEWLWSVRHHSEDKTEISENPFSFPATDVEVFYTLGETEYKWTGILEYYNGPGLDSRTRMMPCRVVVDAPSHVQRSNEKVEACTHLGAEGIPSEEMTAKNSGSEETLVTAEEMPVKNTQTLPPSLLPGMFVKVRVRVCPSRALLELPEMAVLPGGVVWKVVNDRLQRCKVTVAHTTDGRSLIYADSGNIKAGDAAVVSPMASPVPGAEVQIVNGS